MSEQIIFRHDVVKLISEIMEQDASGQNLEGTLASIGIDSLVFLRLQMQIESEFGVSVPDDIDVDSMTGDQLVALIVDQRALAAS
ncbi:acyl carrier protein [Marinivivus vitaminiproducens]|uniref:acyl carrier protein n=1 Tax=Marinivivus vitaminiproducens TaxID=3035935 RepID=UPI00279D89A2|nr:acyl carrier protein [Geminicoccaceae bacterium SCSIO 64248]